MARWLLPLLAVFALLGQTATAYAAAGVFGDAGCCCPVKAKCKCHDHDGTPSPTLKRCTGEAKLVAPVVVHAVPASGPPPAHAPRAITAPPPLPVPLVDDLPRAPEKPPF